MSGIKASRGHCPFSKSSPWQSPQAGTTSETPLTWLTLLYLPWTSPDTLPYPTYRPTWAAFPYEHLVLANASQLPKSYQKRKSWPQWAPGTGTSISQPRFTAWFLLENSKPSTSSSHLRWLYSLGRVAPGKTQMGADLGLYHLGTPGPMHPVDSYKSRQGTATLLLHRWSSMEGKGWW